MILARPKDSAHFPTKRFDAQQSPSGDEHHEYAISSEDWHDLRRNSQEIKHDEMIEVDTK